MNLLARDVFPAITAIDKHKETISQGRDSLFNDSMHTKEYGWFYNIDTYLFTWKRVLPVVR